MAEMVEAKINDRWELVLPDFRAAFHERIPYWEEGRLAHMRDYVIPGMTIYDVGAELGDFTALYQTWVNKQAVDGLDGMVIPFEPKREMWGSIIGTWSANFPRPPAACYVGFVSDITQPVAGQNQVRVYQDVWPTEVQGPIINDPGFHHLAQEADHHPQIRLDEFAHMTGIYPDAVVIDIEGAEWRALRGLGLLIESGCRPLVWVSVHQVNYAPGSLASWYGKTLLDIDDLMLRLYGYKHHKHLPAHGEGEEFHWYAP